MAAQGGYNYRPNVNRNITKKWKDASQVDYEGDDWGDDGYDYEEPAPVSAGNARHPAWGAQAQMYPSNRSVTNPSPSRAGTGPGRASSFDRGDDRRAFSSSAGGGFESPYPTTQRAPFPEPDHDYPPPPQQFRAPPPLHVVTPGQGPYPPNTFRPGSRGQHYQTYPDAPYSAPGIYPQPRSDSRNRPVYGDASQRHESPVRPDSRNSNNSAKFPPRKSSLSQSQPPVEIARYGIEQSAVPEPTSATTASKPLPFIRPADIYKRMEEEREKERRSQESLRQSIESSNSKVRESSVGARSTGSDSKDQTAPAVEQIEELDNTRRLKPTLDTVVERKSEYGPDALLAHAGPDHPSLQGQNDPSPQRQSDSSARIQNDQSPQGQSDQSPQGQDGEAVDMLRQGTNASSIYTDRPDPVSAASLSRNPSMRVQDLPIHTTTTLVPPERYNLPEINRMSGFGTDIMNLTPSDSPADKQLSPIQEPVQESVQEPVHESVLIPSQIPTQEHESARTVENQPVTSLEHKPSLGYKSMVHQAFDQSEDQNPPSAISEHETLPRSNSASTTDISPIISRQKDQDPYTYRSGLPTETIAEEQTLGNSRPTSSATEKAVPFSESVQQTPSASVFQQGYRRESTPPHRDNSPAKQPTNVQASDEPKFEQVEATIEEPDLARSANSNDIDESAQKSSANKVTSPLTDKPLPVLNVSQPSPQPPIVPTPVTRTTSEEWQDWQAHRKQFNARFGIPDSNPTTPGVPSPVLRTDSPLKGTMREVAPKPSNTVSTDANLLNPQSETSRPGAPDRLESFRPQLPGGWQSFSATPANSTPGHEDVPSLEPPRFPGQVRSESSESIPTARIPQDWDRNNKGPIESAFAAVAAAGTALAGSFSGPSLTSKTQEESEDSDDNEWDRSTTSSKRQPGVSDTRDFAVTQPQANVPTSEHYRDSMPPPPLPKDDVVKTENRDSMPPPPPISKETPTEQDGNQNYFPAPLRTTRTSESSATARPPIPNVSSENDSPAEEENDRLQREIVNRLTPKSSNVETQPEARNQQDDVSRSNLSENDDTYRNMDNTDSDRFVSGTQSQPSITTAAPTGIPPIPTGNYEPKQSSTGTHLTTPHRPFLEQRFSWEDVEESQPAPSTPPRHEPVASPSSSSPATTRTRGYTLREEVVGSPPAGIKSTSPTHTRNTSGAYGYQPPSSNSRLPDTPTSGPPASRFGPPENMTFRGIMNLDNQQDRIKAYNESKNSYAVSDGLLEQWLTSMRTTEHADTFADAERGGQGEINTPVTPTRPSAGRNIASGSGPKQMQEDGKRLMAAAGRFGGKAGFAAKGFFAKGKDKLRAASAGDKVYLGQRRRSSVPALSDIQETQPPSTKRHSMLPADPPRLPSQRLVSSPLDAGDWFTNPNTQDQGVRAGEGVDHGQARGLSNNLTDGKTSNHSPSGPSSTSILTNTNNFTTNYETIPGSNSIPKNFDLEAQTASAPTEHYINASDSKQRDLKSSERGAPSVERSRTPEVIPSTAIDHSSETQKQSGQEATPELLPLIPAQSEEVTTDNTGLTVPMNRRRSSISIVSSPSPEPSAEQERSGVRSVSPGLYHTQQNETIPSYSTSTPAQSKEQEALVDRRAAESQGLDDPVPSYDNDETEREMPRQPRIGPDAQIVPVGDLPQSGYNESGVESGRPFSFMGTENLIITSASEDVAQKPVPHSLSPISQTLSKSISQISSDEIKQDSFGQSDRGKKSYSKPFGAGPPLQEHPAYRQSQEPLDRSQMYSSESPLPSARRPQEDFERARYQSPPIRPPEDGSYRIPGPYGQEYRSPKPRLSQKSQQESASPLPSATRDATQTTPDVEAQLSGPDRSQVVSPSQASEQMKSRRRSFGGFFDGITKTKSKPNQESEELTSGEPASAGWARGNMFKRNSRQDGMNYQSGIAPDRDDVRQQQSAVEPSSSRRRLSRDLLRPFTPTFSDRPEGKKKRFSGMTNFFSKSAKSPQPQVSNTIPSSTSQTSATGTPYGYGHLDTSQQHVAQTAQSPYGTFHGTPPPPGGYYATSKKEQSYQTSNLPPQGYYDRRPSDLRIDTTGYGHDSYHMPATAPPQTYGNRGAPYGSQQYPTVTSRGPSNQPTPQPHVIDLHKRSRSPRLGRRSSSEERLPVEQPNRMDPAGTLGTFSNKKISPVGGIPRPDEDQEKPFRIGIPGELTEEERRRRARQSLIEQGGSSGTTGNASGESGPSGPKTVAERITGPQTRDSNVPDSAARAPLQQTNTSPSTKVEGSRPYVAELPGSRANGYESEEEIPMSATAYPGQWQDVPIFVGDSRWDD